MGGPYGATILDRIMKNETALSLLSAPGLGPPGPPGVCPTQSHRKPANKQIYTFGTEQLSGLTAKSPGIQANEGLCLTACARAEVGWGRESGCGIGVMDVTDAKCKRQPKEKQSFS